MSLERFHKAQADAGGYERALAEMRAGQKRSHWIWYVFPQLAGLGRSSTAQFYALRDIGEARDYLRDPVLRGRFEEITRVVAAQMEQGARLDALMGSEIDALKLVSSLTLFEAAAAIEARDVPSLAGLAESCALIIERAEAQGWPRCAHTARQVAR